MNTIGYRKRLSQVQ